jgi:IS605 OrfB family transposase
MLAHTMRVFNEAAAWIAQVCWAEGITNTNTAHHRVYRATRARFGLGAQLAVCARAKAVEAIKAGKQRLKATCPTFEPRGSVRYDARTYRLLSLDRVSLGTLEGRVVCRLLPGHRQHLLLVDPAWRIGGADLVWRDGTYYLHITQHRQKPPTAAPEGVLGVDLGQVNLATDSEGATYSGAKVKGLRAYYHRRRQVLQKVGTKSAKRKMRRTKRREQRMMRDVNHRISKALVAKATTACKALSLEDLTHIRERTTVGHARRYHQHAWAFWQLREQITYKAAAGGVAVVLVDPRNTSRTCSACGHCEKANRQNQASFLCRACGFTANADCNAAVNIAYRAAVNWPMVSPSRAAGTSLAL